MGKILRILKLLRPYWFHIAQSLAVAILVMLFSLPGPYITKILIDHVYPHRDFSLLTLVLVIGAAISSGLGLTSFLRNHFRECVGISLGYDYQSRFFHHLQTLDFNFFDNRETGELVSRFGDMNASLSDIIGMINSIVINLLRLLVFPAILFYINWKLALISMIVLPFDATLVLLTRKHLGRLSKNVAESSAKLSAHTYESLSSIRTIQALGLESDFFRKFQACFLEVSNLQVKTSFFQGGSALIASLIRTGSTFTYGWFGWTLVLNGEISLGSYFAFTAYVGNVYGPLGELIGLIPQMQITLVHTNRFLEIYDLKPAVQEDPTLPNLREAHGTIEFHNVSFSYNTQQLVLDQIDLVIPPSSTVALVGRSGAGKSTLVKLLMRLYDPQEGFVSIAGQDIRQIRLRSLRQQIGFAMQGSTLFQATVWENLTFGKTIPHKDVIDAAKAAYIHDDIVALPEAYHTQIGEHGSKLSEGQRQRLALARVLLMDTPILILDEPTAALDLESESRVQEALKYVRQGRTTLVIAHRLSTIKDADKIVVMDDGKIAEMGIHETLVRKDQVYANLYKHLASM